MQVRKTTTFRDLRAWQAGMQLVQTVYEFCATLPSSERFGLSDQLRRAAVSVPANIAEGYGRGQSRDYLRFLSISLGSVRETETLLLIAQRIPVGHAEALAVALDACTHTGRPLHALHRAIKKKLEPSS
ncbi:MAG TPA: four helix bundle protein, partial [Candidatus Elarobacter sp.]|nr:four helix bundle protein [Candidatus Elarobacter sp.]